MSQPHISLLKEGGLKSEVGGGRDPPLAMHRAPGAWTSALLVSHPTSPMVTMHLVLQTQVWRVQSGSAEGPGVRCHPCDLPRGLEEQGRGATEATVPGKLLALLVNSNGEGLRWSRKPSRVLSASLADNNAVCLYVLRVTTMTGAFM